MSVDVKICYIRRSFDDYSTDPYFIGPFDSVESCDAWVDTHGGWEKLFNLEFFRHVEVVVDADQTPQEFLEEMCEIAFCDDECVCGEH